MEALFNRCLQSKASLVADSNFSLKTSKSYALRFIASLHANNSALNISHWDLHSSNSAMHNFCLSYAVDTSLDNSSIVVCKEFLTESPLYSANARDETKSFCIDSFSFKSVEHFSFKVSIISCKSCL